MKKDLSFVNLAGIWFAVLPDYDLGGPEDLVMVDAAATLCYSLDKEKKGFIKTTLYSYNPEKENAIKLEFLYAEPTGGAWYSVEGFDEDIWICDVTKYVFEGKFPLNIYIEVNQ